MVIRIYLQMFRINTMDLNKVQISSNIHKIHSLLSKTMVDLSHNPPQPKANPESPIRKRLVSNLEPANIEQIKRNLQKGYLMIKHSPNTSEPHNKFVYLSSDAKDLCWKSLDKEDEKRFPLKSVIRIVRKVERGRREDLNSRVVVVSQVRNLELESGSQFQAEVFRYQLNRMLEHVNQMRQNYLYCD